MNPTDDMPSEAKELTVGETLSELYLPYPAREDRLVRVYVPAHAEGERLSVIYMTDGQNLFDKESSGFGCWYTRQAVRAARARSGKAAILVGIHNDNPQRENELLPASIGTVHVPAELRGRMHPCGEGFDEFVVNTVMPAVEARFPVKIGRENTAFCGSSMGGLQAFFTVLSHPDRFCAAGMLSPALLFYSAEDLRRWIRSRIDAKPPYLYLYSGAADELEQQIYDRTQKIWAILAEDYPPQRKLVLRPDQPHHETAWEPIFADFLHDFLTGNATPSQQRAAGA